ncbi:DUF551 domain-containing protein [Klebsiella quasipneumoniae]|uniref:DUF551 domain-containing protein n=1 Tax=Klebsiella quasipneumoniae TaxID=1463165 RepID=UPI003A7F8486
MTKSTITRERFVALIAERSYDSALVDALEHLLEALEAEPVYQFWNVKTHEWVECDKATHDSFTHIQRRVLYTAPPAPIVQPMMFIDGDISSEDADKLAKVIREFNEEDERPLAKMARIIRENPHPTNECDMPKAQPAPVVPEEITIETATIIAYGLPTTNIGAIFKAGHDACRAAMLQAYPVCTCPSGDGSLRWPCPVHPGNSPAQSDCCPAQNGVNPEQKSLTPAQDGNHLVIPDGYVMVPEEPTDEMLAAAKEWTGLTSTAEVVYIKMLAAAPHDTPALNPVQSVVTVPGKWIPVSERMPEVGVKVLCFPVKDEPIHATFNGQLWLQDVSWSASEEPIDNAIPVTVTHWMPLPAVPQEVKGE